MSLLTRQSGDTLVEVTLALAILASVLTAALSTGLMSLQLGRSARERTMAMSIAQEQAEALHRVRDSDISASPSAFFSGADDPGSFSSPSYFFHMVRATSSPNNWMMSANPTYYSGAGIQTGPTTPDLYTVQISPDMAVSQVGKHYKFDISVTWEGNTADLTTDLYNVGDLKPIDCSDPSSPCN